MAGEFNVVVTKKNNNYLARCMELGVACQGATEEEAKAGLIEAVEALLESYRWREKLAKLKSAPPSQV